MKINIQAILIFLFGIVFFSSCEKENPNSSCENSPVAVIENDDFVGNGTEFQGGFFVLNEGGYTYGNASVTHINGEESQSVFSAKNNYALGDVLQSATQVGDELYLVVNNSQKIEVVNRNNFERIRTLTGFSSPRYLAFKDETTAAITDFAANEILLVNMQSGCIENRVTTSGWTEQIIFHNQKFYAIDRTPVGESNDFASVLVFNSDLSSKIASIDIALEPNSLEIDAQGNLWILSSGKESENVKPALTKINTLTNTIVDEWIFPTYDDVPLNLAYSTLNDELYFHIDVDVYTMDVAAAELPTTVSFSTQAENIYLLNISPTTNDIYISDAKDYVSTGQVFQYSTTGSLLSTYDVGIIPSEIVF